MNTKKRKNTPPTAKKKRGIRLKTPSEVRKLMGRTINQVLAGELQPDIAKTVGYLSQVSLKSMEIELVQQPLAELKQDIENLKAAR